MDAAETARMLRQRAADARALREVEADRIREMVRVAVRDRLPAGARAWLIGSLAWGTFGPRSDVDLVLDGVPPSCATEIEIAVARAAGVAVDVLLLRELPESFRARVEAEGVALHAG